MRTTVEIPDTDLMTRQEFREWLMRNRSHSSVRKIARWFHASYVTVWQWSVGKRNPERRTLALASLLASLQEPSRELAPGLPPPAKPRTAAALKAWETRRRNQKLNGT